MLGGGATTVGGGCDTASGKGPARASIVTPSGAVLGVDVGARIRPPHSTQNAASSRAAAPQCGHRAGSAMASAFLASIRARHAINPRLSNETHRDWLRGPRPASPRSRRRAPRRTQRSLWISFAMVWSCMLLVPS